MGDWADEKAREWMAEKWLSNEDLNEWETSLAALLREVWEQSKNTEHSVCVMFDGIIADKDAEKARVLAEVRRVVEDAGKHRVYSDDLLKARDKALRDEILSRLDAL